MSFVVVGASSAVATEVAKVFARAGHNLLLISRDTSRVTEEPQDVSKTNVTVKRISADISSLEDISHITSAIISELDDDPYVLFAVGALFQDPDPRGLSAHFLEVIDVNFRHVVLTMEIIAKELESRGKGCIIALSSVAGDRGRKSNYVYGAAKAGLNTYTQGLRNRLATTGIHVLTVKLGYVDTPMFRRALGEKSGNVPRFLVGEPSLVAEKIARAAFRRKNVVYIGRIWKVIMLAIRLIPETVFKRLDI
jgi:decaprenylphospho-beta-D-erythro-pentofuranosid-2-ulose 2-reductase